MESSVVGEHLVPPLWNQVEWSYRCMWGVKIGVLGMPITSRPFPDGYYVYFMCLHVSTPLSDKSVQGLYQTLKTCMDIKINVANIYSLELSKLTQTRAQEKHFLSSTRKKVCCVCAFVQTVCPHRGTWGLSMCEFSWFKRISSSFNSENDRVAFLSFSIVIIHVNGHVHTREIHMVDT